MKEGQSFLDENPDAEKDQYDEKRKEIEGICDPIIQKGMGKGGDSAGDDEDDFDDEELWFWSYIHNHIYSFNLFDPTTYKFDK